MKNQIGVTEYLYDYAVDGGTVGTKVLSSKNGKNPIPVGAVIKSVVAKVLTALTSGGAATLEWGNDDTDGFSGATIAVASMTLNSTFNGYDNAAALLWDDANDHPIYPVIVADANAVFNFKINDFALTAGKVVFCVEYWEPAVEL